MTDPIKAKIIELVPDVIKNKHAQLIKFDRSVEYFEELRPITLAVVLRAIRGKCDGSCASGHNVNEHLVHQDDWCVEVGNYNVAELLLKWNLEQDNYDQQSEEYKQFIGSLLLTHEA